MITVDTRILTESIMEAEAFNLPDMSGGACYLYDNFYTRLSREQDVRLSDIDFGAFELHDIDTLRQLYADVLEANEYRAGGIADTLRRLPPVAVATAFV